MQQYADIYLLQIHSTCFAPGTTTSLQRGLKATLEGSSCTSIMTCTGGCGYSF